MKTLHLSGLPWHVHSPSLLAFEHPEGQIALGFNGRGWQIALRNVYGATEWSSRDQAASLVAQAIAEAGAA